jgi:hypothetical protein
LVPRLPRYYEALRLPNRRLAALRCLRLAIPRSDCHSSPFGRSRTADGSSRSLLYRLLPIRSSSRNCQDLPSSRGTLVTIRPALRPRRDRIRGGGPIVNGFDMAPASNHDGGSPRSARFRGLITRHLVWLSTPRSGSCPPPRKTRFRLLVPALPGGIRTRRVPVKGFRILRFFLPSRVAWRKVRFACFEIDGPCAGFVSRVLYQPWTVRHPTSDPFSARLRTPNADGSTRHT